MIQIKKTILTLVALLAVTTGAWADGIVCTASDLGKVLCTDGIVCTASDLGKVLCTDGSIYENVSAATTAGKTAEAVIAYVDETNKNGLALALTDIPYYYTWDNSGSFNEHKTAPEICSALNTSKAVTGGTWKLPSQDEWKQMFKANGGDEDSYTGLNNALAAAGGESSKLQENQYWSSSELDDSYAWLVSLAEGNASWLDEGKHYGRQVRACLAFDIAAASGPTVAWDKATKTGTFTMPGGNVTLEPEYYDLATLADKGLTAAEDAAAKTEAPLAVLAENAVTGGTLMYYVATDENFSQADAIALAETEWSAAIPTAEELNPAGGTYYVWYYIKGDDEHSDTDPQRLAVTVLPEPTYNVEFAEGTNNAPNKWTATPNPAKKGQQVTVTYEGPRKVMGVKAEKKGGAAATDLSTINANYTANDGETLTGTLGANVKISIAAGATVTLDGVSINANGGWTSGEYAGITCEGNATIILSGTNAVKAFDGFYPGIYVPVGSTVTINGSGSLTASSNGGGAGIGGGWTIPCGNIEIQGGTIEATAGNEAAGIGGGTNANCGNITISGGTVTATGGDYAAGIGSGASSEASCGSITISGGTVTATGAKWAAGIGSGAFGSSCGAITITSGVTHVTATKGEEAHNSIGAGDMGSSCGTVSIEDPSKVTQN